MPNELKPLIPWWGDFDVPLGAARRWRIGPLTLRVSRLQGEWRIAREMGDDPTHEEIEVGTLESQEDVHKPLKINERIGFAGKETKLTLEAALPDRSVVSRPESTFLLPAGERLTIYVGSPLWVQLKVGDRLLADIPTFRPSDTFFGRTTMEGELCYASRTYCRVRLEDTIRRPHRSITAVEIRNLARAPLPLERVQLPVSHLALYRAADGRLWTQDVTFERGETADAVKLAKGKPTHAEGAELLTLPRLDDHNLLKRFSSLFSFSD